MDENTSADQNAPTRIASFFLDGSAGWRTDGLEWKRFTSLGPRKPKLSAGWDRGPAYFRNWKKEWGLVGLNKRGLLPGARDQGPSTLVLCQS